MKRIIFDILVFILLLISPWWISLSLLFIGIFIFKNYLEFIIGFFVVYSVYAIPKEGILYSPIFYTAIIILSYIIIQYLKNNIIFYKNN
jgi:hypothetical protein